MLLEELELQLGISSQGNVEIVKVLSWMVECISFAIGYEICVSSILNTDCS